MADSNDGLRRCSRCHKRRPDYSYNREEGSGHKSTLCSFCRENDSIPDLADDSWMTEAACAGMPIGMFFSDKHGGDHYEAALPVCQACPVRPQCLEYALSMGATSQYGMWGGASVNARRKMLHDGTPASEAILALQQQEEQERLETERVEQERLEAAEEDADVRVPIILHAVADRYGFTVQSLLGGSRYVQLVSARHVAMYLVRELTGITLAQTGKVFGGRDHTTVVHAVKKVECLAVEGSVFEGVLADLTLKVVRDVALAGPSLFGGTAPEPSTNICGTTLLSA